MLLAKATAMCNNKPRLTMISKQNQKVISQLLAPSSLSGLLAILIGLVITGGVLIVFATNDSAVQQQLIAWQPHNTPKALTTPSQHLEESDKPTLKGSWPLLIVWSGVGLIVYGIAMAIVRSISSAKELTEELEYVNAKPVLELEIAVEHFIGRFVSATIAIGLCAVFVKQVIPYSITAAHAAAADILSGTGLEYSLLSFAIVVVTLHIITIFSRLAVGRVRIFNTSVEV